MDERRKRTRHILIKAALLRRGYSAAQIQQAFDAIEQDTGKPILDWLINGGFEEVLAWIIAIINLFSGLGGEGQPAAETMNMSSARPLGDKPSPDIVAQPGPTIAVTPFGLVISVPVGLLNAIRG